MGYQQLQAQISGLVQGVWFRANTKQKADELGITGTVHNLDNGDVACIAEGTTEQLNQLIAFWQSSPGGARVQDIRVEWADARGAYKTFTIEYI